MYSISNRRYTGSKYKLLDWIEELVLEHCRGEVFLDVFAGTGVVSSRMRRHYRKVLVNDFLFSNEVIYQAFFGAGSFDESVLEAYRDRFRGLGKENLEENYVSENFGGRYFSENDARQIGAVREEIKRVEALVTRREYYILLASLLYSMDKVANTVGHYDAYRKNVTPEDRFCFELIAPERNTECFSIYRMDANALVRQVKADVVFVDPPYNSRQYSRFYHVLENVAQWKKPKLEGTALKPGAENMSDYCRNKAPAVFADLIQNIDAGYIVVTYNNTYHSKSSSSKNKITLDEIADILSSRGRTEIFEKKHPCFNAGKTEFEGHKEYVFITRVSAGHGKS